jgi:hypothetical protein
MKRVCAILMLASCSPVIEVPAPIVYPGACPFGDTACQRNADAQTLAYIGQQNAAMALLCLDENLAEALSEQCGLSLSLY